MATTTNYSWVTPDDTSLVKDGAAAIRSLGTSVDTTTKALNPSTTLGDIEYRSSTANTNTRLPIGTTGQVLAVVGGVPTWATTADQTPLTTKGDIFTFTTVDARLGVGANGTVLTADSAEATGLKWATPASSGATLGANTFTADQVINGIIVGRSAGNLASNTVFGATALDSNTTGYDNTAVGLNSLTANTTGYENTAVGKNALTANTTGYDNTAIGMDALLNNVTGLVNTAVGQNALKKNTNNYNCGIGNDAGSEITTGTQNTILGVYSNGTTTTGSNNTVIGYNAQPSSGTVSNTITLGSNAITTLRCQVTSITALSDERDKKNIEPLEVGLDFVNSLKPVTFDWNMRPTKDRDGNEVVGGKIDVPDAGFIAQDFIAAEDAAGMADHLQLTYRDNPEALEITQGRLIPILVKAIQDLSAKIEALESLQA